MTAIRAVLTALLAAFALGACFGMDYDQLTADIRTRTAQIALGVHDRRPYVVDGAKKETFTGLARGGYNNPFDTVTASGKPVADDMAKALAAALTRNGTTVTIVRLEPAMSREAAIARLAQGGRKAVLLTIFEWKLDVGFTYRQLCELELHVVGPNGAVQGQHRIADEHMFNYNMSIAPSVFNREVPPIFKRHIEELFSAPSVAGAL